MHNFWHLVSLYRPLVWPLTYQNDLVEFRANCTSADWTERRLVYFGSGSFHRGKICTAIATKGREREKKTNRNGWVIQSAFIVHRYVHSIVCSTTENNDDTKNYTINISDKNRAPSRIHRYGKKKQIFYQRQVFFILFSLLMDTMYVNVIVHAYKNCFVYGHDRRTTNRNENKMPTWSKEIKKKE